MTQPLPTTRKCTLLVKGGRLDLLCRLSVSSRSFTAEEGLGWPRVDS